MTTHGDAMQVLDRALATAVEAGKDLPCRVASGSSLWLSDRHEDRREAAEQCAGCPVLDACAEVGQHEPFGTWGGRDRTRRPGKKLPPRPTTTTKPRPALDPIACHGCGEMFTPSRTGHTYCRQACRTRLASAERRRKARKNTEKETAA